MTPRLPDMNYTETIDFLYSQLPVFHRIGKAAYKANLDNTLALDRYFGHPHRKFRSVHIAGTNGKGSVSHMLASVFQEAGYKTALYTSPHLKDYRERIRVNGKMIPKDEVTDFVKNNMGIISELNPSFFEMSVAMAFEYFARENVDVAIVETGLGGRLDSTNIIDPLLSVITNIGYDHMDLLGDTLGKIASEKAGIIKNNTPVIIGETSLETEKIFLDRAEKAGSKIYFADQLFSCSLGNMNYMNGERRYILTMHETGESFEGKTGLGGDYQSNNIPVVACAVEILRNKFDISETHIEKGIEKVMGNTGLSGRWQILNKNPLVICDTGHNKEGISIVLRQLGSLNASRIHFVIGFVNDKDLSLVLPLFPSDASYYFTKAAVPRALDQNLLMAKAAEYGLRGDAYENISDAYRAARVMAASDDIIFIGGSTFVVAEVI
jgi:dihydrofolate synthase / folylpolyglutamate synthase